MKINTKISVDFAHWVAYNRADWEEEKKRGREAEKRSVALSSREGRDEMPKRRLGYCSIWLLCAPKGALLGENLWLQWEMKWDHPYLFESVNEEDTTVVEVSRYLAGSFSLTRWFCPNTCCCFRSNLRWSGTGTTTQCIGLHQELPSQEKQILLQTDRNCCLNSKLFIF